jgi:aminotransferase
MREVRERASSEAVFNGLTRFLDPLVIGLPQVGSRELEIEIGKIRDQGRPVLDVYGYPVVPPPEHVWRAAIEAAQSVASTPSNGILELRQGLARAIEHQYGFAADPEKEILITNGAMHALHVVLTSLLRPNDEVVLIAPCYFFGGLVQMAGARPVLAQMPESEQYALDFKTLRGAISERSKAIIVSTPVNPTGRVYSRQDVEGLITFAEEYDLLLISDESYDRMIYDGIQHVSPLHYPEGRARTILIKSFTKSYALPNWRVGYICASAMLLPSFRKVLEWMLLHCPYVNQRVALAALEGPQGWLEDVFLNLLERRNQVMAGIEGMAAFSCPYPQGGPFIFLNVSARSEDCDQFAHELLYQYGVPAVPGRFFHSRKHVRIPFGGSGESVRQLVQALNGAGNSSTF